MKNLQNYFVPKTTCPILSNASGYNIHSPFLEMRIQFPGIGEEGWYSP
jgi:hypothetical protein